MAGQVSDTIADKVAGIDQSWYVPRRPPEHRGWQVYTLDFVLATLQGFRAEPQKVRRTAGWMLVAVVVRAVLAILQVLLMVLAWIPLVGTVFEIVARTFTRNEMGLFLRACYWKAKLGSLGQDTIIEQNVEIWGAESVSIGSHCHIDTNVRLAAGKRRHHQRGSISIGDYVHLGPGVHIAGRGTVSIGDFVAISANAHLYSATNMIEYPPDPGQLISMSHMAPPDRKHIMARPIEIEAYAFIGMQASIMPGVRIGRGAVIHANTELWRSVPPFANIGGVPRGHQIGWRRPRRASPHLGSAPADEGPAMDDAEVQDHET